MHGCKLVLDLLHDGGLRHAGGHPQVCSGGVENDLLVLLETLERRVIRMDFLQACVNGVL